MSIGETIAPLLGRLLLSAYFFYFAWVLGSDFDFWASVLLERGVPSARFALGFSLVVLGIATLGLMLGHSTKVAGLALFAITVAGAVLLHDFWTLPDGAARDGEIQSFLKDMGLAGGLLMLVGQGGGAFAWDNRHG